MHDTVLEFCKKHLRQDRIANGDILEVGSMDVNGSIRQHCMKHGPASYTGLDIAPGPGVDIVADIETYVGPKRYDGVICTEVFEHIRHWWKAVRALSDLVVDGGWLLLTTRSPGYPVHYYPGDYWRFTVEDLQAIFGTWVKDIWTDLVIEKDIHDVGPGVMMFLNPFDVEAINTKHTIADAVLRRRRVYSIIDGCNVAPS